MNKKNRAFSLVELSIVILIIGVLVAAVGQGLDLLQDSRLAAARTITKSSRVSSLRDLALWFETTSEESFIASEAFDGNPIGTWNDINPQRSKVVATSANKPIYTSSAIGGLPALRFDGLSSAFDISNIATFGTDGATIFFVAAARGTPAIYQNILTAKSNDAVPFAFVVAGIGGNIASGSTFNCARQYRGITSSSLMGGWNPALAPTFSVNTQVICSSRYDGLNIQGWTNKTKADTPTALSTPLPTTPVPLPVSSSITIGTCGNIGCNPFSGDLAELIVFNRALNPKERNSVEDYLSKKWSIKFN